MGYTLLEAGGIPEHGMRAVYLSRRVHHDIALTAATTSRECGGLLVGRVARGGSVHVHHTVPLTPEESKPDSVSFNDDEAHRARVVVHKHYWPLEAVGEWHPHYYDAQCRLSNEEQLSDHDLHGMLMGDIEVIAVTYPLHGKVPVRAGRYGLVRVVRGTDICVRLEAWVKVASLRAEACTMGVLR